MGCVLDAINKSHWFLRSLDSEFISFATSQINLTPMSSFHDLLSKAEAHDIFTRSLDTTVGSSSSQVPSVFAAHTQKSQQPRSSNIYAPRGSFQNRSSSTGRGNVNLVESFRTSCSLTAPSSDWYMDTASFPSSIYEQSFQFQDQTEVYLYEKIET
ncbi:hypothetical protein ACS0TY_008366 [Phlomoides rotata]